MSQKTETMSTSLTMAHVIILLVNFSTLALAIHVNLMIPDNPVALGIALGLVFFLAPLIPFLIHVRSYKGTAEAATLYMSLITGLSALYSLLFWVLLREKTSYFSIGLSVTTGFSAALLVADLRLIWKIWRMFLIPTPNVIKSTATVVIALLLTPGLAPVFAVNDFRYVF